MTAAQYVTTLLSPIVAILTQNPEKSYEVLKNRFYYNLEQATRQSIISIIYFYFYFTYIFNHLQLDPTRVNAGENAEENGRQLSALIQQFMERTYQSKVTCPMFVIQ
jgi:hypothetical protein